MIRTLGVIAASAALVSIVCVGAAAVITGPEAIAHGAWSKSFTWRGGSGLITWSDGDRPAGPVATRDMPWGGEASLTIDLPADVTYVQSAGPSGVHIKGPKAVINDIVDDGGRLSFQRSHRDVGDLSIVVTAPAVRAFNLDGSGKLKIENYRQDHLALSIEGSGDATLRGVAQDADVTIEGSGDADLADLQTASAKVRIDGSGDVRIAPSQSANVDISGSGDVDLLSDPPKVETNVSGSGEVRKHGRG